MEDATSILEMRPHLRSRARDFRLNGSEICIEDDFLVKGSGTEKTGPLGSAGESFHTTK